jgi:hypothetical protein
VKGCEGVIHENNSNKKVFFCVMSAKKVVAAVPSTPKSRSKSRGAAAVTQDDGVKQASAVDSERRIRRRVPATDSKHAAEPPEHTSKGDVGGRRTTRGEKKSMRSGRRATGAEDMETGETEDEAAKAANPRGRQKKRAAAVRKNDGAGGAQKQKQKEVDAGAEDDDTGAETGDADDDGEREVKTAEEPETVFSDIKTVAMYALAGAVAGACYRMATSYREKTYAANNLEPEPVAFDVDPLATHLFGEFSAFRRFDEVHYLGAFHATDWILNLERVLSENRPRSKDEARCQRYHRVAKTCAHRLCVRYVARTKRITPQREREVAELLYDFEQFINKHMLNVTIYCKNIHKIPKL